MRVPSCLDRKRSLFKKLRACFVIILENNFEKWFLRIVFENYYLIFVEYKSLIGNLKYLTYF